MSISLDEFGECYTDSSVFGNEILFWLAMKAGNG
jgi:hypothetical protein